MSSIRYAIGIVIAVKIRKMDWRRAKSIAFLPGRPEAPPWFKNYVEIENFNGGTWPLHPGTDQVGPMLAAGNEMMWLYKAAPK